MSSKEKVWDTDFLDKVEDYTKFFETQFNKALKALEKETDGDLKGVASIDGQFRDWDETMTINLNIEYHPDVPPHQLITAVVIYNKGGVETELIYIDSEGHECIVPIESKEDFNEKFTEILLSKDTGNKIRKLLYINKQKK